MTITPTGRLIRLMAAAAAMTLLVSACSSESGGPQETPESLRLLAHDSFALSDGTLEMFTEQTGIAVNVIDGGDAGTMVNQAILTKDNPIADVIFGVDNTFISRAINNDILVAHTAADIDEVDVLLRLNSNLATPIDYGDVCVNYDISNLGEAGVDPPETLEDLVDPLYRDMLVVQDPATSSPGLAFLMATIARYPDGAEYDWKMYWEELFGNGVSVASDWSEAYYTQFSIAGGTRPLVVSYASSPPAEVLFGELEEAPTAVMTDGCFRQIEYAAVLNGTSYPTAAGQLVDFLLSRAVQEDIPLNMFVYPTNKEAALPPVFIDFTTFPEAPVVMEPTTIEQNRERWIAEWTEIARNLQ
jgi:thiamine transport system substrate-binding protein